MSDLEGGGGIDKTYTVLHKRLESPKVAPFAGHLGTSTALPPVQEF